MLQDHERGRAADAPGRALRWTGTMPRRPSAPALHASHPRLPRRLAAAALVGSLLVVLPGCAAAGAVGGMTSPADGRIYATAADADGRIPSWIPADATDIRLKASLRGQGAILEFRSATPADSLGCTTTAGDDTAPAVQDTWWPDPSPAATMSCGDDWHAAADGDLVRAWLADGAPALRL
jgi:hypothetical protein